MNGEVKNEQIKRQMYGQTDKRMDGCMDEQIGKK